MLALGDCVSSDVVFGAVRANQGRNTSSSGCHVPSAFGFHASNVFPGRLKPMPTTGSPVSRRFVHPYCNAVGVSHGLTMLLRKGSSPHSATAWLSPWMSAMYGNVDDTPLVE